MAGTRNLKNYYIILILAGLISLFLAQGLGKIGLEFKADENYYYQSSRRMLETGDFTTPYYFEKPRFEKPILYYWFAALFIKLFGLSWSAARVASVVFACLFLVLLYNFCLFFQDRKIAILSVLISATSLCFFRYARILLPEMAFLFFLFGFFSFFFQETLKPERKIKFIIAYIFLGLATLLKGPVAIILAVLILFLYSRISKRRINWSDIYLKRGVLIISVIVLPWFIRMIQLHGDAYLSHVFIREIKDRVMPENLGHFLKGLISYIPVILYFYLPWIVFAPSALYNEFKKEKKRRSDISAFLFSYIIVIFVFFSLIHEKHRHYMLYMTPALAILIARFLAERFSWIAMRKAVAAIFIITVPAMYFFGIAINQNAYTLDEMFSKKQYRFEENDHFAIGSYQIHPSILEANIARPVKQLSFNWPDKEEGFKGTVSNVNHRLFLAYPGHAYLLLSKEDYERFGFLPRVKKDIKIIGSAYLVKKPDIKNIYKSILKRDGQLFRNSFRRKVIFITNKN